MDIIINGILSGLVLSILIGPVFFTILQTSLERGFIHGVYVAVGVSLSDAFYIFVSYLGLVQFMESESFRYALAYLGGFILLVFGCYYLLVKSRCMIHFDHDQQKATTPLKLIAKGFIINGLSPIVLFFWIATVGVSSTQMGYDTHREAVVFFGALLATVFCSDVLKAKGADKLRDLMTTRFIRLMNILLGVVLIVFAGRLIFFPENILH